MANIKFSNNASGTLASGIASGDTSLTVNAGEGDLFPAITAGSGEYFYATLVDNSGNREIIKVTERQSGTNTFQTIVRAQDGTSARAFSASDQVELRLPRIALLEFATLTGSETLTNKTLTAPVISSIVNTGTLTLPTATDTLVGQATTDTLTNKTLTSPIIDTIKTGATNTGATFVDAGAASLYYNNVKEAETISGGFKATNSFTIASTTNVTGILDEDDMASNSAVSLATQQSIKAYVDTHAALTAAHGASGEVVGTTNTQTLTHKTLNYPTLLGATLNTSVNGSAVKDEDDMASNSSSALATQQSIKAYVDNQGWIYGTHCGLNGLSSKELITGLPTDVIELQIMLYDVYSTSESYIGAQFGTSSAYETSGYVAGILADTGGGSGNVTAADAFFVGYTTIYLASALGGGLSSFVNVYSNTWAQTGTCNRTYYKYLYAVGGHVTLSGSLYKVKIYLKSSGTWSGGYARVRYKTS